jgi:orotidine-5'-phosphate decarboxylase
VRAPFGQRLADAVAARGPLCVGIDPHVPLLERWGLSDSPEGLARFTDTVVEALAGTVAVLKPQLAFYERHGSRGLAVLEDGVARARAAVPSCCSTPSAATSARPWTPTPTCCAPTTRSPPTP